MNYKKAYYELFNNVSDIIEKLKEIQMTAEETCISEDETAFEIEKLDNKN